MSHSKENNSGVSDRINGALLVYHHPLLRNATTIMEHVNSFEKHSRFRIWSLNTELGFPSALENMRFKVILLHYSLFGIVPYQIGRRFLEYLRRDSGSFKIAFFQDEQHYCLPRYDFLNTYGIDIIYTLLEPRYFQEVYGKYTSVRQFRNNIPGYVSDELIARGERLSLPDEQRTIDISYRGRRLAYWLGKAAQEKHWIVVRLRGSISHRDAYGARVTVRAGGQTQLRELHTSPVDPQPLHFGLGTAVSVDEIRVRWPSGIVQTLHGADIDQVIKIAEPAECVVAGDSSERGQSILECPLPARVKQEVRSARFPDQPICRP